MIPVFELSHALDGARPLVKDWREVPAVVEHAPRVLRPPFVAKYEGAPVIIALDKVVDGDSLFSLCEQLRFSSNERSAGMTTRSRTFGYNPRHQVHRDCCYASAVNYEAPTHWAKLKRFATQVAQRYREALPEEFAKHEAAMTPVLDAWRIEGTPFTSGIVNQSAALPYHRDAGNFEGVWSCMITAARGVSGGELVVPELGVSVEVAHGGLFMFDGQRWLHGVAPIRKTRLGGARYSCVFYSLREMWKCLTPAEELARIRKLKTEKERRRAKIG